MKLYNHVKIKESGIVSIIVDIYKGCFTVEADEERRQGDDTGYPGKWPLYFCKENQLEQIFTD